MRTRTLATLAAAAAVCAASASPAAAQNIEVGHIPQCLQAVPAAVSVQNAGTINLNVKVLRDGGLTQARADQIVADMVRSWTPLNMAVVADTSQAVNFSGTDAAGLIAQAKTLLGGAPPPGFDVVYVLTAKDQTLNGDAGNAGLADCIGGVAHDQHAFATGEDTSSLEFFGDIQFGPLTIGGFSAKVMAHEIGHLFGGHHHYANCAEGFTNAAEGYLSPCSLMFNDITLASFNFSAVNSRVVRGHGWWYARP